MQKKKIIIIGGARPNFMKIAPLYKILKQNVHFFETILVHTGQHYDYAMSQIFFEQLGLPAPDIFLNVGSASHAVQTATIMLKIEKVFIETKPDLLIVVGDVNSTIACALTASKLGIKIAHIEAGLRSFDMDMPEEINRILTDRISDFLFTTEISGDINLQNEGVPIEKIFFVGNTMIDTLISFLPTIEKINILVHYGLVPKSYAVATIHRPSNVDTNINLYKIVDVLNALSEKYKILFPIHPRTKKNLSQFDLFHKINNNPNIIITEPLGYLEFMNAVKNSKFVLTDSGGIQEETTYLGIPCITLRENTERPSTILQGTNRLSSVNINEINLKLDELFQLQKKKLAPPLKWDGKAAMRIVDILTGDRMSEVGDRMSEVGGRW